MTRRPVSDERSVVGPAGKSPKSERFYLGELCGFLRASRREVAKFLRARHLLRSARPSTGRQTVTWTSARGVALAVAHFRAVQGYKLERGEDVIGVSDRNRAKKALLRGSG
jgi:hypothetical protein